MLNAKCSPYLALFLPQRHQDTKPSTSTPLELIILPTQLHPPRPLYIAPDYSDFLPTSPPFCHKGTKTQSHLPRPLLELIILPTQLHSPIPNPQSPIPISTYHLIFLPTPAERQARPLYSKNELIAEATSSSCSSVRCWLTGMASVSRAAFSDSGRSPSR